jgi:hypothetical protein
LPYFKIQGMVYGCYLQICVVLSNTVHLHIFMSFSLWHMIITVPLIKPFTETRPCFLKTFFSIIIWYLGQPVFSFQSLWFNLISFKCNFRWLITHILIILTGCIYNCKIHLKELWEIYQFASNLLFFFNWISRKV